MLDRATTSRVAVRRSATRREILDAAWAVAREVGLAELTLREVAHRVGMRAPSLYSHFASKNAIYDAMFGDAWTDYRDAIARASARTPAASREALRFYARAFFDFAVADLARYQLMNQRVIVRFEPSAESYAPAVAVLDDLRNRFRSHGVSRDEDVDLYVAIVSGLIDAQLANDPGGTRWARLLDRAIDMFADDVGIR